MGITLLIRADEQKFQNGRVGYSIENLEHIKRVFPDFTSINISSIDDAIGIFAKKEDAKRQAKRLKVQSFQSDKFGVRICFVVESELAFSSDDIKNRCWAHLKRSNRIQHGEFLPYWCVLETQDIEAILEAVLKMSLCYSSQ